MTVRDNKGYKITEEQQRFFADNHEIFYENGLLKRYYHGTDNAGFFTIDTSKSDDGTSFFLTDNVDVATTYMFAGDDNEFDPYNPPIKVKTFKDLKKRFEYIDYTVKKKDGVYTIVDEVPEGCVFLMERPEDIQRKFKRAITDSDTENCVRFDPENKPGVANLMSIYSAVTGKTFEQIEAEFAGQGYGKFKPMVGDAVIETLRPIREESERLLKDKAYLESVYRSGAEKAAYVAEKTLRKVYKKIGFLAR